MLKYSRRRHLALASNPITGPDTLASINALSQKYMGHDYANPIQSERVILRIAPDREVIH